jgi:hypothetical protein
LNKRVTFELVKDLSLTRPEKCLITVKVRSLGGDFCKIVDVPPDMTLGDFKEAVQEAFGLPSLPCALVLEKTNKMMRDSDTFESAGIESGSVFILTPESEGCAAFELIEDLSLTKPEKC